MSTAHIIFWTAVIVLAYTYLGYPMLLWVWAALRARPAYAGSERLEPTLTVLVVAHNEAARVQDRIENLLALDYPRERIEIVLASDGSTDDTAARARRAGVTVIAFDVRRGKSAVLNELIPKARGEIVVLADARQRFASGALLALAAAFADPKVGAVSGELVLTVGAPGAGAREGVGFYWNYEKFIRRQESRVDSTVGATGAIYAIRRGLFEPIPAEIILDDVLIPMRIVRRGYRALFHPAARAYDQVAATAAIEFARKTRTLAGNCQLFVREPWLLNPCANRLWLQTLSHKVCRLLSPPCLGAALIANLFLISVPFYRWVLAAQAVFYAVAIGGCLMPRTKSSVLNLPYAFCLLNWAAVVGFFRFINGRQRVTWERGAAPQTSNGGIKRGDTI